MTEKHINQDVDTVQTTLIDIELDRKQVMDKFGISSLNTLKRWCAVVGIECGSKFEPEDIAKLSHLHHHVSLGGMSMKDYESMINGNPPTHEVTESHGRYTTQTESEEGEQIASIVKQRYQASIDRMAKPLAMAFWESLDSAVLREVAMIAESNSIPSRLETNILPSFEGNDSPMWLLPPGGMQ